MIFVLQSSKVTADESAGLLKYEGNDYVIELNYEKDTYIPKTAYLKVSEVVEGTDEYEEYFIQTKEVVQGKDIQFARFFDISIMNEGEEIEPDKSVNVTIRYTEGIRKEKENELDIIHFLENESEEFLEVTDESIEHNVLTEVAFEQESFSVIGMIIFDGNDSEAADVYSEVIGESYAIDVIKEWSDGKENHGKDAVSVELYESENGTDGWNLADEKVLNDKGKWKVQFNNLSQDKSYKVRETEVSSEDTEKKITYKAKIDVSLIKKWTPKVNNSLEDGENVFLVFNNGQNRYLRKSSIYDEMNLRMTSVNIVEGEYGKHLDDSISTMYIWQTIWNEEMDVWEFYNAHGNAYLTLGYNEEIQCYEWGTSREKTEGSYLKYEDGIISATVDGKTLYLGNITSTGPYKALEKNDKKITKFEAYSYKIYQPSICNIFNKMNETVEEKEIQTEVITKKTIDYLGDGKDNPETKVDNEYSEKILRDLYRLNLEVNMRTDATGLDLLMVIDVSSSMKGVQDAVDANGNKIKRSEALRQALNSFIPAFLNENERNRLSVVAFEEQAMILQEWTSDSSDILEIINYVDDEGELPLYNGSGTNYEAALSRAHEALAMRGYSGNAQAMFFLSDGEPTTYIEGNDDQEAGNVTINLGEANLTKAGIAGSLPEGLKHKSNSGTDDAIIAANEAIESFRKHNSRIMIGTIAFNTKVTDSLKNLATDSEFVVKIENGTPKDLINAMELITEYIPRKIIIVDELSENVDLFEEKPDYLVTMRSEKGENTILYSPENGITEDGKNILMKNQPVKIEKNKVELYFLEEYEAKNKYTYSFSFNVRTSQTALNKYADSKGKYKESGDKGTDYDGNDTSSEKAGFYSNGNDSCVKYVLNGAEMERRFPKPVIQVRDAGMTIKKTDMNGKIIPGGAGFILYREADVSEENTVEIEGMEGRFINVASGITNENGEIVFDHLRVSVFDKGYCYYLIETEAPEGYVKCEDVLKIDLFDESVAVEKDNVWVSVDEEGKVVVFNAEYVEPLDIPVTGGKGKEGFYITGILLITGGIICLRRKIFQN